MSDRRKVLPSRSFKKQINVQITTHNNGCRPAMVVLPCTHDSRQRNRALTEAFRQHPDHDVFGSLPGAKATLGPRLLAEVGWVREEYPDADALLCQAGVSPVSYRSGKGSTCRLRRACNKVLRATVHLWANASRLTCEWA